jgi:hypothetical protein
MNIIDIDPSRNPSYSVDPRVQHHLVIREERPRSSFCTIANDCLFALARKPTDSRCRC